MAKYLRRRCQFDINVAMLHALMRRHDLGRPQLVALRQLHDLLGDVELRGLIVTLADDLVDVQSCDEESMSDRWWERYPGY